MSRPLRRAGVALGASLVVALPAFAGCASDRSTSARGSASTSERVAAAERIGVQPSAPGASLALPSTADAPIELTAGDLAVRFGLKGAANVASRKDTTREGVALFPAALGGADVMHASVTDGVEDLVFFDVAPEREELVYDVDVSHVAGLHAASSGALELLDARGVPRIRVDRPFLVDATGAKLALDLRVDGCAVDTDPTPSWGRPVLPIGARTCQLHVAWSGARYPLVVDPLWRLATSSLQTRRVGISTFTFPGGKIIASGGKNLCSGLCGNGMPVDSLELYDPAADSWTSFTLAAGRINGSIALLPSGKAFLFGGGGSSRADLVSSTGAVSRSQDFSGPISGERLTTTSLATGKILVAGGDNGAPVTQALLYDEATDSYAPAGTAPAGSLKIARAGHTATVLPSGKVLLAGGSSAGGPVASAEIYDPVANTFTLTVSSMSAPRSGHIAAVLPDKRVLLAGGGTSTADIFDPVTGAFTATGSSVTVRTGGQAVVLKSGDVMIAGGTDGAGITGSVEVFDVATKTFVAQPGLTFARAGHGAALVPSGDVLVFGGQLATGYGTAITELWHPGAAGSVCTQGDDCLSGSCEEGVCCATSCGGACKTCAPTTGACIAVTKRDDPNSCTAASTCDPVGACKKKNGQACTTASECAGAVCVDGTCCDRACEGQCEACNVKDHLGTCSPVAGEPRNGRAACTAPGALCGGTCNGLAGAQCAYPSAVTICASSCSGETFLGSYCDGRGACTADDAKFCPGNFVCADAVACKTSCVANADCRTGFSCEAGKCLPIALCEDHFVTKGATRIDCAPYTCEQAGNCRDSCASVSDCVAPTVCSLDGRCIDPPGAPDSGCSVARAPGTGDTRGLVPLLLAGLLFVTRARSRRRSS